MTFQKSAMRLAGAAVILIPGLTLGFIATSFEQADAHGAKHNPARYQYVKKNGIPKEYTSMKSPAVKAGDITKGATIFAENCASCHGSTGEGDGPDGKELKPKPPALRSMMKMMAMMRMDHGGGMEEMMSMMNNNPDGYLIWTISEGGADMETAMPGFKDILSESERWQVINFMLNDFEAK